MNTDVGIDALILRLTHISRCSKAFGRSSTCTCLPVARRELIKHALASLTLDEKIREMLLEEISKISSEVRDSQ
jgi:hypothetical protein